MKHAAEVVVLGAGPAGYVCAIRLAQLGKKVTVVDRAEVGGVCLNRGCIPSKALIHASHLYEHALNAQEMGIEIQGAQLHLPRLMKWKDSVVQKLTQGVRGLLRANGCTLLEGEARFTGTHSLEVKTHQGIETLTFQQCVIATGSRPAPLPGFEVDQERIIDSTGALNLQKAPASLLCIGGGYIGLELGTFYSKIGTQVTVLEAGPGLLAGVDPDLARVVAQQLKKRSVSLFFNARVLSQKKTAQGVQVTFLEGQTEKTCEVEKVFVAIGRVPNTESLGLDRVGLKVDGKGFISVNAQRRTAVSHIYAIGDVAGQPLLAHKGSKEGMVAAEAIAGMKTVYDVVAMPAVIFTDPEIATVGMTVAEAKKQGLTVQVGQFPYAANGRALSLGAPEGFAQVVGDASGKLLGVHIVGAGAADLIAEAALALEMGAMVEDLALTVHPHPTLPETIMEAAEAALGHPIHIFQKKSADGTGHVSNAQ